MAEFDHGFKIVSRESGRALARIGGLTCTSWKLSESTLQTTTERLADRVFVARQAGEKFVVYFEFVTTWHKSTPWKVLGKSGLLAERERLPVASVVFVLQPRGYVPQNGTMRLTIGVKRTQQVWFNEVRLWEVEPAAWWEQKPGLMALYLLCRHHEEASQAILHAANAIEAHEQDAAIRADLLTSLGIFGRLAYPRLDPMSLIGREKMKESKAYREIMEEGAIEFGRSNVLNVVSSRFGERSARSVKSAIESVEDLKKLTELVVLAAKCSRFDDFVKALRA